MALTKLDDWTLGTGAYGTDLDIFPTDSVHGYVCAQMNSTAVATYISSVIMPSENGRPHKLRVWLKASSIAAGSNVTVQARAIRLGKALGTLFTLISAAPLSAANTWLLYEMTLTDYLACGYYIIIYKAAVAFQLRIGLAEVVPMKKCFSARLSANAALTTTGWRLVPFDTEESDYGSIFDTVNSQFVCPAPGYYSFDAGIRYNDSFNAGNVVGATFWLNAAEWPYSRGNERVMAAGEYPGLTAVRSGTLAKGDTVEVRSYHNYGSNRSVQATTSHFSGYEVG